MSSEKYHMILSFDLLGCRKEVVDSQLCVHCWRWIQNLNAKKQFLTEFWSHQKLTHPLKQGEIPGVSKLCFLMFASVLLLVEEVWWLMFILEPNNQNTHTLSQLLLNINLKLEKTFAVHRTKNQWLCKRKSPNTDLCWIIALQKEISQHWL